MLSRKILKAVMAAIACSWSVSYTIAAMAEAQWVYGNVGMVEDYAAYGD